MKQPRQSARSRAASRRQRSQTGRRQFWKGYLRLSLVTCPVEMTPAVSVEEKVRFHILNRATGNRVVSRYFDSVTGAPVDEEDQARGYPRGDGEYIVLEEEELEAAKLESLRTIDIESFAPIDSIDPIWRQTAYYITPDDPVGVEAYCVIRDAMRTEKMAAISRLVLQRRERAVMLEALGDGIVLWTLRYGEEVHDAHEDFADSSRDRKFDPELVRLVAKLIDERRKPWSEDMVEDPVQSRLLELIAEKRRGARTRPRPKTEAAPPPNNVVSIMDALRKSVAPRRGRDGRQPKS